MSLFKAFTAVRQSLTPCKPLLRAQSPGLCVLDHMAVARVASTIPRSRRWRDVSKDVPSVATVKDALKKQPCVLIASGIAQPGSKYTGHHAITLLEMVDDENVLLIDRDDTLPSNTFVYTAKLADLLAQARVPMNENLDHELVQVDPVLRQPDDQPGMGCIIL